MSMSTITLPTLQQLLEAGVHFGHQRARSHPKSRLFTYTIRDGIYIIDLELTLTLLEQAINYLKSTIEAGKIILLVGTKPQYKDLIESTAKSLDLPYVASRWLGGTLTNFEQARASVKRLEDQENLLSPSAPAASLTKKERVLLERKLTNLRERYGGLRQLKKLPDILLVVDPNHEQTAVKEAKDLHIPVVAIMDTTTNPGLIDVPIPGNDDSRRSVELILKTIAEALVSKASKQSPKKPKQARAVKTKKVTVKAERRKKT